MFIHENVSILFFLTVFIIFISHGNISNRSSITYRSRITPMSLMERCLFWSSESWSMRRRNFCVVTFSSSSTEWLFSVSDSELVVVPSTSSEGIIEPPSVLTDNGTLSKLLGTMFLPPAAARKRPFLSSPTPMNLTCKDLEEAAPPRPDPSKLVSCMGDVATALCTFQPEKNNTSLQGFYSQNSFPETQKCCTSTKKKLLLAIRLVLIFNECGSYY